jgi:hypothetical protein
MWRQRVAATKIDSPLMVVSGRHAWDSVRHRRGDEHIVQFLSPAHTTGDVAMMHTGGEKSISARDRVRDLRDMARVACFTMNANSCHTTSQPPTPTRNSSSPIQIKQLRQSFIEIVVPALRSWCRTKTTPNREGHWAVAGSLVLPPICWVDYRDTRATITSYACMGLSCSTRGYRGCSELC